jgi:hypothetical protein
VSPAEAALVGPHYDLVVDVLDVRLLGGCESAAEQWAPVAAILCVEGASGQPGALPLAVGCDVPDGYLGWYHGDGRVCVKDKPSALGCAAVVPHELGHALGVSHQPEGSGLMAAPAPCSATITDHDLGRVSL